MNPRHLHRKSDASCSLRVVCVQFSLMTEPLRTDPQTNTYQLAVGWDGRETFVQFLYADGGIQWIAGEGKTAHHSDARGQAGLISGDGRFTELEHSGTDQVRHLDRSVAEGHRGSLKVAAGHWQ